MLTQADAGDNTCRRNEPKHENAIFSQNCLEWIVADYAILCLRGVSVPIYATNTPKQAEFVVDEAEIGIVFAGTQEQYDHIRAMHGGSPKLNMKLKRKVINQKYRDLIEKMYE